MRRIAEREQGIHPPVSIEEDELSLALGAEGIPHKRQVKIETGEFAYIARTPYFTVDFLVWPDLIVEVDGRTHATTERARDLLRDAVLEMLGYRVTHVTNQEVNRSPRRCATRIRGWMRYNRS